MYFDNLISVNYFFLSCNPDFYLSIPVKISQIFYHQNFFDQLSNNNPVPCSILRFHTDDYLLMTEVVLQQMGYLIAIVQLNLKHLLSLCINLCQNLIYKDHLYSQIDYI